jgi:hypothetical protein
LLANALLAALPGNVSRLHGLGVPQLLARHGCVKEERSRGMIRKGES